MKRRYNNDPRQITARFNSFCAETGNEIKKGEQCIYYPASRQVFTLDSKQAQSFREQQFDAEVLGYSY